MKKHIKNIGIFMIIAIIIAAPILTKEVDNLDELWNYNFARNVSDGKLPYKDFSMMQMPLLPLICGNILRIFGNELIVMRILAVILSSLIFLMSYKILEQLKTNKYFILLFLMICYNIYAAYLCIDYNFSILLIILTTIYFEIKTAIGQEDILVCNTKKDFVLGILVGTSILFKQTTGAFLSIIFILHKLLLAKKKQDFKITGKIIFIRTLGVLIPIGIFAIYLTEKNIWLECIDYTILSIKHFSNSVSYRDLFFRYNFSISILSILVPITIIYMYFKSVVSEPKQIEQKILFIFFAYSVACFIVVYPIADPIHFLIGSLPSILAICYICYIKIKINKEKVRIFIKNFIKVFNLLLLSTLFINSISVVITCMKNSQFSTLKHYKYTNISADLENEIKIVDDYILNKEKEGKKVYILDATACVFMIPIDNYNKNYDNFTKGCFGSKDSDDIINDLENEENIIVLITKDNYLKNWQTPLDILEHITNNWVKIDSISRFDAYVK